MKLCYIFVLYDYVMLWLDHGIQFYNFFLKKDFKISLLIDLFFWIPWSSHGMTQVFA
ncbi:hypothetical protein [Rickettsia asembonensis]|uniref:hypothetical protein n=1 Tax=Rickettsia asembonensis TaxID=1068590 RepID=UPI001F5169B3|nr:hypothetical protein [Rickettsia asembonensis]